MNSLSTKHLSDDDLDEILMGVGSPAQSAHLDACNPCGQRYATFAVPFQEQMSTYNQATLDWSEARSNTISRDLTAHRLTPRLTWSALCSTAAALALALALGWNAGLHHAPAAEETAAIPVADSVDQQHEIASDNEMLQAISSEIGTPRADRFGLYEPVDAPAPSMVHSRVKD